MKKALLMFALAACSASAIGQTTVTFKPGPAAGEDATIWRFLDSTCVPTGYTMPPATLNFGSDPEALFATWTWNTINCNVGDIRLLLRFSQLATIPPTATILNAELVLRTPNPTTNWGNNYYPGSPLLNDNKGWVKRILPGASAPNNWNESTVTWNTAPTGDPNPANWVEIPLTGARYGWTQTINVTNLVQDIVFDLGSNPAANNGFLLMLQNETYYRQQCYASSDHPDATLWPELKITYEVPCDPDFSFCANTLNPYNYAFTANTFGQSFYSWMVNGTPASGPSINYTFPGPGTYEVCLYTIGQSGSECTECLNICVAESERGLARPGNDLNDSRLNSNVVSRGDDPLSMKQEIDVVPNPALQTWDLAFKARVAGKAEVTVYDLKGNAVKKAPTSLQSGNNQIQIDIQDLSSGMYLIEIQSTDEIFRTKGVKQ